METRGTRAPKRGAAKARVEPRPVKPVSPRSHLEPASAFLVGRLQSEAWPAQLFDQVAELLAEALVLDFQQDRKGTVSSPQGIVRKIWFMDLWNEIDRSHEARR